MYYLILFARPEGVCKALIWNSLHQFEDKLSFDVLLPNMPQAVKFFSGWLNIILTSGICSKKDIVQAAYIFCQFMGVREREKSIIPHSSLSWAELVLMSHFLSNTNPNSYPTGHKVPGQLSDMV